MPNPYHVRLAISQYGDQFRAELFTEDLGDTDGDVIPTTWETLDQWVPYLMQGGATLPPDAARQLGKELFAALLGKAENSKKWTEIVAQAQRQGRPLRMLIDAATDAVRDLPYGLLCEPHDDYYLLRPGHDRPAIQFVRILRRCTPRPLRLNRGQGKIRLLLVVAEPVAGDVPAFGGPRWLCRLASDLRDALDIHVCTPEGVKPLGDAVSGPAENWQPEQLAPHCRATREALRSALADGNFDILHLMAHGLGDAVLLCDRNGGRAETTASELGEWCSAGKLQMAFLQVCKASQVAGRGGFGGLAQQLLNPRYGNLAAVVASPFPLDAEQSTPAASAFYRQLARQVSPDEALDRALPESNWTWAFLELWVRPGVLGQTGTRGAFQFASPYRGLTRFEERDAEVFFGREAETAELLQILNSDAVVTVVGDSGSGKSSLLQAGLAATVRRSGLLGRPGWRIVSPLPGAQPLLSLSAALVHDLQSLGAASSPCAPEQALTSYLSELRRREQSLLLIFDQFEEIFTVTHDDQERRALADVLARAVQESSGNFRLVLGMRSEYLGAAAALPGLVKLIKRPWVLRPPGLADVRAIVARPAEVSGYRFEGSLKGGNPEHAKSLLDRILVDPLLSRKTDSAASGSAAPASAGPASAVPRSAALVAPLPLLEFALERLWLRAVNRGSFTFTHADFDEMGGLAGAIANHAEDVYQSLPTSFGPAAQSMAEQIFTGLVSMRGTRRPRRRAELENRSGDPALARKVLDHLIGERLLTVRSDPNDLAAGQVDLTHEVLLERWERLKNWLAEDPKGRAQREEFERDSERWDQGKPGTPQRSRRSLPGREVANDHLAWLRTRKPTLTAAQTDFAAALGRLVTRENRKRRMIIYTLSVLVLLACGLAFWANQNRKLAEAKTAEVKKNFADQLFLHGLELCERGSIREGLLVMAHSLQHTPPEAAALDRAIRLNLASWSQRINPILSMRELDGTIRATSRDGRFILADTADGFVRLHDHDAEAEVFRVELPDRQAAKVAAVTPDGGAVLAAVENTAWVWDTATRRRLGPDLVHPEPSHVIHARLSPDHAHALTVTDAGKAYLWDLGKSGSPTMLSHPGIIMTGAFSPDSRTVIAGGREDEGGWAQLWNVADGTPKFEPITIETWVHAIAFTPNGQTAVLAGFELHELDATTGRLRPEQFHTHFDGVDQVAFSPDGRWLTTGSMAGTVRVFDVKSRQPIVEPLVRLGQLAGVFVRDTKVGPMLVTAETDGTVRRVALTPAPEADLVLDHPSWVLGAAVSPDGSKAVASLTKGLVRVWDLRTKKSIDYATGSDAPLDDVCFASDGSRILCRRWDDGRAYAMDLASGRLLGEKLGRGMPVAFSADGRTVLLKTEPATLQAYDLNTASPRGPAFEVPGGIGLRQTPIDSDMLRATPIALSPDGKTVVTVSFDRAARLWDVTTGRQTGTVLQTQTYISTVAFSLDGQYVITISAGAARVWNAATAKAVDEPYANPRSTQTVALSPNRRRLIAGTVGAVARIWNVDDADVDLGAPNAGPPLFHKAAIRVVAFCPDGQSALTGSNDFTARLWDIDSGKPITPPLRHDDGLSCAAFFPDGRSFVTGSFDKTLRFWKVPRPLKGDPRRIALAMMVLCGSALDSGNVAVALDAAAWIERRRELETLGGMPTP